MNIRSPDDRGLRTGEIWMSPGRDIVNVFPGYMTRALEMAQDVDSTIVKAAFREGVTLDQLGSLAQVLAKYTRLCADPEQQLSVVDAFRAAGLYDQPYEVRRLFDHCLANVILSAYHHGCTECRAGSWRPFVLYDPDAITAAVAKPWSWRGLKLFWQQTLGLIRWFFTGQDQIHA